MPTIALNTEALQRLCEAYQVRSLYLFGSALREDFHPGSDIDLLVDFETDDPLRYADLYFGFKDELTDLFDREIDLLEARALRNPYFKQQLDETKVKLYGN